MFLAVEKGHISVVRELLLYVQGVDINHRNGYGNTALHESAREGHLEVWKWKWKLELEVEREWELESKWIYYICLYWTGRQSDRRTDRVKEGERDRLTDRKTDWGSEKKWENEREDKK